MISEQPPSIDITDPQVLAGAKRVATRRNNDARRKLAKERAALPLLAEQIPSEPAVLITPERVIEDRKIAQAGAWENGCERDIQAVEKIRQARQVVFDMVPVEEYLIYYDQSLSCTFPLWAFWYNVKAGILARLEPMTEIGEWLLTILNDWEGEPPTHVELHHKCGDGRELKEILDGILWLERRRYVRGGVIRSCAYAKTGSSTPWSITEAGKRYLDDAG